MIPTQNVLFPILFHFITPHVLESTVSAQHKYYITVCYGAFLPNPIRGHHLRSLKSAMVRVFTPQKPANPTKSDLSYRFVDCLDNHQTTANIVFL